MIYIDFETRSELNLLKVGAWVYSRHPSTEVMCLAWTVDDGPVHLWTPGEEIPGCLGSHVFDYEAHNAFFEKCIWENIMMKKYGWPPIPPEQWYCSASLASAQAIPRALGDATKALGLSQEKDTLGHTLMMKMAKPKKSGGYHEEEADLQKLYEYCKQDVRAERGLSKALRPLSKDERKVWLLDQKINRRGIRVDLEAVEAAMKIGEWYKEKINVDLPGLTDGVITKATQRERIVKWLNRQGFQTPDGEEITKLGKEFVEKYLEYAEGDVKKVLEIRLKLAKSSVAKYAKIMGAVDRDDQRLRDLLMYHGSSTGRWTGKVVQPHNFPKNRYIHQGQGRPKRDFDEYFEILKTASNEEYEMCFPEVMDYLSMTSRGIFIPSEGKEFFGGDFSSIEARVSMWLAGDESALNVFRDGGDIYKELASFIYDIPVSEIEKDSDERQLGKQGILGCGFGIGWESFKRTCEDTYKIIISEKVARKVVDSYRDKYHLVVKLWKDQEAAVLHAVKYPGKVAKAGKTGWVMKGKFLYCRLPSGRFLSYYDPKIEMKETPWKQMKEAVTYMTLKNKKFIRTSTYGGKIVENITQAVARDLMAHGMQSCEDAEYEVVLSVHDELLAEKAEGTIEEFEKLMATPPAWGHDIPVAVGGWRGKRYLK